MSNDSTNRNASITVAFGDTSVSFDLTGAELSEATQADGHTHRYLSSASREHIAAEVEKALLSIFDGKPLPLTERWTATITPESWDTNDYIVEVAAPGETSWDASEFAAENWEYLSERRFQNDGSDMDVLDRDDVFQNDPNAPEWVRTWDGPFTIRLTLED